MDYRIICDEAFTEKNYPLYSAFYGGLLLRDRDRDGLEEHLEQVASSLGLTSEVKWGRIDRLNAERYVELMGRFFDEVEAGLVRIRVMFTMRRHVAVGLSPEQRENTYNLLYYQFIKHSFGLEHAGVDELVLRLDLDNMPQTEEKKARFKEFLWGLQHLEGFEHVRIHRRNISEIDSKQHRLAQCLDVVLGSCGWRLNQLHKHNPGPGKRRFKRTVAKHQVQKAISERLRKIRPYFNIGENTGLDGDIANRWRHPVRHWVFVPSEHEVDPTKTKRRLGRTY